MTSGTDGPAGRPRIGGARGKLLALAISLGLFAGVWIPGGRLVESARGQIPPGAQLKPTPTIDFLPAPTQPAQPTEADRGAYAYWLYCMACHGNQGQGLTAEFRAMYPPSDQNCWESGCHGPRPYEGGWTLPFEVPPVIGESVLEKYGDAAILYAFISASMPWQAPGSLNQETYRQVVAYLVKENGLPAAGLREPGELEQDLSDSLGGTQAAASQSPTAYPGLAEPAGVHPPKSLDPGGMFLAALAGIGIVVIGAGALWKARHRN